PVEREVRSSEERWYLARLQPYRTHDNRIDGVVLTFVDISERKRAEDKNAYLASIVLASGDAIIGMAVDGTIESWNPAAERVYGYTAEEAIGQPITILGGADHADEQRQMLETLRSGVPVSQETVRYTKDGNALNVIIKTSPVIDAAKRVVGFSTVLIDISERKQSENALRASEERFRALIDHGVDVISISDGAGNITYASPSIKTMTGYSVEEFTQHNPFGGTIHPDDRAMCEATLKNLADQPGASAFLQHRYLHKSGEWRWLEGTFTSLFHNPAVGGLVANFRDITERKVVEVALQHARDDLEQRVDERTAELVRLNTVRQDLLHRLVGAQEEERRRVARELHDQMGQSLSALRVGMASLVGAAPPPLVETIARLQALAAQIDGEVDRLALELRPSILDDLGLVAALQQHVDSWSQLHGIAADLQVIGPDGAAISTEIAVTLYRVAQEALTNVFKHAAAQRVSVVLDLRPDLVGLIIEDNGRGFDAEAPRDQLDREQLGLLGMQERVALVGGTLTIESAVGAGTTLYLRVPLTRASEVRNE
ncbi:MAG: PAS domain S-box protein, partial [Chloroflexales bacterium]|nr:PAS domain S-box protein [Chloroflexales bacterium]